MLILFLLYVLCVWKWCEEQCDVVVDANLTSRSPPRRLAFGCRRGELGSDLFRSAEFYSFELILGV